MSKHSHKHEQHALIELWDVFLRHRWRFIIPAFLITATVLSVGLVLPRKYRSVAMFERRNDLVLTEMSSHGATRSFQDPRQSMIEAVMGIPALDELLDQVWPVIEREQLLPAHVRREDLRDDLHRRVSVRFDISTPELDRIRVEYIASSPEVSKLVVNGLIENYIARTRAMMEARLRESAGFFRDEVVRHRAVIETLENGILEYEINNGALLPDTPNNVQARLLDLEDDMGNLARLRESTALRVQGLRQSLADTPSMVPTVITGKNPELDRIEGKRRELRAKLTESLNVLKMTEHHPDVLALKQALAGLDDEATMLQQEVVTSKEMAANPQRSELELSLTAALSELKAYDVQIAAIRVEMDKITAQTNSLFEVRSTHRKLNRDLDETRRQLGFWEENLRRVEMALAAESGNRGVQLEFIGRGETPTRPVSPNLVQVVSAAMFLGVVIGTLTLFHAHRNDETFSDGEQLSRRVELPLFGGVSEIVTRHHRHVRRLRHLVLYPTTGIAMGAVLVGLASLLYLELEDPAAFERVKQTAAATVKDVTLGPATASAAELPEQGKH